MNSTKTVRTTLIVSLAVWLAALLAMQFVGGQIFKMATLVAIYSVPAIILSAVACLIVAVASKRKTQ